MQLESRSESVQRLEEETSLGQFLPSKRQIHRSTRCTWEHLLVVKADVFARIPKGKRCHIPMKQKLTKGLFPEVWAGWREINKG